MAKTLYVPVNNLSSEVKKIIVPVGGLSKYAVKGYCSVNGLSKLFWDDTASVGWQQETNIPYSFSNGSAVVFQNKIHLLGGTNTRALHYTFDGNSWTQETNLPFYFYNGSAIAFDGKIHCFGGGGTESQYYTYDGSTWTHEADLPDTWITSFSHQHVRIQGLNHATIYNGKLTLACSNYGSNGDWRHIATLNNGSWSVNWNVLSSDVMYSAVGYDGLIYLLGDSGTGGTKYNTWDGSSQSGYNPLPIKFKNGYALVYNNKIHLLGGNGSEQNHYSFNGSTFSKDIDMPYPYFNDCPAVVYKDRIHIFGSSRTDWAREHWSYGSN